MEYMAEDLDVETDTVCDCGREFEFFSGNRCSACGDLFCEDCVDTILILCPDCGSVEE
jgi:hypothetical protein